MGHHRPIVDQRPHDILAQFLDLLNLVGGAEAVEEVDKRHARLERGRVRNQGQVHGFLDVAGGQHGKAGGTRRHNIGMVAEDRKRLGRQRARRHMKHRGSQLARDLVHVGDHQEQTL